MLALAPGWAVAVFLAAALVALWDREHLWRNVALVALALPAFVVGRIVVDSLTGGLEHSLAPFEVLIACVVAGPTAIVGAAIAVVFHRWRAARDSHPRDAV
jgi:hypothetical protein